ncbi:MAG: zf-HC2 domain-containing protein [Acidobacteriota bacterium]
MSRSANRACRGWRDHLVEAVYGELQGDRRRALDEHLRHCPACRAQLAAFRDTIERVADATPARPQAGTIDLWPRIDATLDAIDRTPALRPREVRRGLRLGYPAAAALAAALLLLGLGLGVFLRAPVDAPHSQHVAEVDEGSGSGDPELEFARFLERSTPLLLAVANRQLGGPETVRFDLTAERRVAEHLAQEATSLAATLEGTGLRRQADLLRDLKVVFLQLANLPPDQYHHGLAVVQATLDHRALLFQLSVEEMRRL